MAKRPICSHEKNRKGAMLYRCRCGNVWIHGKFFGSLPPEQGALAVWSGFARCPAKERRWK